MLSTVGDSVCLTGEPKCCARCIAECVHVVGHRPARHHRGDVHNVHGINSSFIYIISNMSFFESESFAFISHFTLL